ncbi:Ig-like domain-containing protein, partial [Pseudomonas sp. RTC3]|nr:Ig-like domain-containing protein [Pseudomonas sp. RTC3]
DVYKRQNRSYAGVSGTSNLGGRGGAPSWYSSSIGGAGGSSVGGSGANSPFGFGGGSAGGTASNGSLSIGGGGGGAGYNVKGGNGGNATGGIYNARTGILKIVGTSVISNNLGAGGGGGGGGYNSGAIGGDGGEGVGAIWNKGTLLITAANVAAISSNAGASGIAGTSYSYGSGANQASVNGIFNDGGTLDPNYLSANIVVASNTLKVGETSQVTITFREAVTDFTNADLTIANGTLSAISSNDGGKTWIATLTPTAAITDSTNVVTLDNTGVLVGGYAGAGIITSNNYAIDTVRPMATVVVSNPALNVGGTSTVTISFSEAVSGFTSTDMSVTNGTLSALTTSDSKTWTATLTPTNGITTASNTMTLDNTGYTDTAGNAGVGLAVSNNYAIDTVRPTATIVVADTALSIGETSPVTITFSEAVSGFTAADLTVVNGVLSGLTTSDNITWTATFTPNSGVSNTINVITLSSSSVVDAAGNTNASTTYSNTYAVDTQRPNATVLFANTNLGIGQTSLVTITFSEVVTGFTNADLTVSNGTLSAVSSSDGGITWTATFTPTASIVSASNHITLDNTGVQDTAGNAGSGTTTSNNVVIDGVRPTATVVVANHSLIIGQTSLVTITFSEAVVGFSNADLTIANGTLSAVSSSDGGITWTANFTPTASITNASNVITLDNTGYSDTSGNAGTGSTNSNNYAIDTQRPTATIVVADPALTAGETSLVTITFSEAVTGFTLADLSVSHGSLSGLSTGDGGITWTATFTPGTNTSSATNAITLTNTGIADIAGNAGAGTSNSANFSIDTVLPSATIVMANPSLKIGDTSLVTITFNEAVTGFSNADLSITNGTLGAVSSSDGGITWTGTFTPTSNVHDTTNLISLNNAGYTDLANNAGTGITNSGNFTIDTVRPTATIVVADNALNIGETSLVTITFSEAVSGFSNADLTISNGTLTAVTSSDGGITWTATFTPTNAITDSSNLISLDNSGVQNASGNTGSGTTDSNNFAIDTARPTATIVVTDPALGVGQTTQVTITFSEAVSGFDNSDLTIDNATLSNVTSSDGGITWTATLTPLAGITDTSNIVRLGNAGVQDLSGNMGSGTTDSNNYAVDSQRPTATIVLSDTLLRAGEASLATITFSEAVSGFDNSDLTIANGTLSAVNSSDGGITWTATFTPTTGLTDTTNVITLNNTGVSDLAGNAGVGTTDSANYMVETQVPTATIVVADNALKAGETSGVTITFSEAVSGFTNADLTIANGSLSNVSSSDGGITWTATFIPTVDVTDSTNLISLDNRGVTNASGNSGVGVTDSNNFTIDTVRPTATIVVADNALNIGETSLVTITFSEAVSGFDNSDLTVANGSLSNVSSRDGGMTWTAAFTPTGNITGASNRITLNNSGVSDLAGNAGVGSTDSNNYAVDTQRPTASVVVASSALTAGQTSQVTITFSEAVSGFDLSDLSATNGTLSNLSSHDGGQTWTATLTPTANINVASNLVSLNTLGVTDLAGNAGTGSTNSNSFGINSISMTGDPEFRTSITPAALPGVSNVALQPNVFAAPPGNLGSPLAFNSLFQSPTLGSDVPALGNIFINNQALAPSYIAQVFGSSDSTGSVTSGFHGAGGGDGGVFGTSTISGVFGRDSVPDVSPLNVFDGKQWNSSSKNAGEGVRGIFGAPTLSQQLHQLKENEQRQIRELTLALVQIGASEAQA